MSNHSHLLPKRSKRLPQPWDRFSKAQLWERLQRAEKTLREMQAEAERSAHELHNAAQSLSGEARRALLVGRNRAYAVAAKRGVVS